MRQNICWRIAVFPHRQIARTCSIKQVFDELRSSHRDDPHGHDRRHVHFCCCLCLLSETPAGQIRQSFEQGDHWTTIQSKRHAPECLRFSSLWQESSVVYLRCLHILAVAEDKFSRCYKNHLSIAKYIVCADTTRSSIALSLRTGHVYC